MSSSTNEEASAVVEEVEGGDAAFKSESKHLKKKKKRLDEISFILKLFQHFEFLVRSTLVINLSNCKYDSGKLHAVYFYDITRLYGSHAHT